jgi:hypothetical protein
MHPTADTHLVIHFQRLGAAGDAGRSAAPVFEIPDGGLRLATARGSFTITIGRFPFPASRASDYHQRGVGGAGFEFRGSRQVLGVSTTHPNKPMHPTADTVAFINSNLAGRRVIGGVGRLQRLTIWHSDSPRALLGAVNFNFRQPSCSLW